VELDRQQRAAPHRRATGDPEPEGVFTGSDEAERRAHNFTGTNPVVQPPSEQRDA